MRERIERRLNSYWKLEAANVVLLPAISGGLVLSSGDGVSAPLILAMLASSGLLVIGAIAWRMELANLRGEKDFAPSVLPWLSRAQSPALVGSAISAAGAVFEVMRDGGWSPSAIATSALAALALLEYLNYYVVQVQHFDHAADFKRLMTGRGFREAHLAKALRVFRRRR